mmetsp:Transcript_86266/g.230391  ORF Transcript_86266/g.230391 Transcript_86266/m.230391 type:complete len:215 (-) Transcript_86266:59-703(-)
MSEEQHFENEGTKNCAAASFALLVLNGQEQLELSRQLVFGIKAVREVDSSDPAVGMNLDAKSLNVVRAVGTTGEVGKVKLNLVPALVEPHRHGADERLHTSGGLIVGCSEASTNVLVIKNLNFEGEIFLQILDDHNQEGKLNAECFLWIGRTRDVVRADIRPHNFQDTGLNILICNTLDMAIANFLVPNLQRLAPDTVQNRQETGLESVLEHRQ